jgi:hypothetical protein
MDSWDKNMGTSNVVRRAEALSIVVTKENDAWIAVCLENNIVVQADSKDGILELWKDAYFSSIVLAIQRGLKPLQNATKAPARYHKLYAEAKAQSKAGDKASGKEPRKRFNLGMIPAELPAEAEPEYALV